VIGFGFNDKLLPYKTWRQRAVQICFSLSPYLSGINRTIRSWAVLALVASGKPLVIAKSKGDLEYMIAVSWLLSVLSRLETLVTGAYCGYREVRTRKQGYSWLSPYLAMGTIRELLPRYLSGAKVTFIPTGLLDSSLKERDRELKAPFLRRVCTMVVQQGLWYHILKMTIVLRLMFRTITASHDGSNRGSFCRHVWTHALAPGLDWDNYFDLLAPLAYALLPTTVPSRFELLEEHLQSDNCKVGARLPKMESRVEKWNWWWLIAELPQIIFFMVGTIVRFRICPK
jgi:hypothetical protein